ncbi:MAG: MFS transporter, partial [Microbacterium sp.]|nr:MFS transporter [Microbacterium sp.]
AALTLGWPISGSLAGRVYLRIGFRATAMIGSLVTLAGAALLVWFALTPSIPLTALACFVVGLGLGLVANPTLIAAQSSVGTRRRGVASGTNMLARSIGSSVGVAVFGAVANTIIASRGGSSDPGAIQAGTIAVFVGVALGALVLILATLLIPRVTIADEEPSTEPAAAPSASDADSAAAGA